MTFRRVTPGASQIGPKRLSEFPCINYPAIDVVISPDAHMVSENNLTATLYLIGILGVIQDIGIMPVTTYTGN